MPASLLLLEHLQHIVKTDQLLVVLHGIRPDALSPHPHAHGTPSSDMRASPPSPLISSDLRQQKVGFKSRSQTRANTATSGSSSMDSSMRTYGNLSKFLNLSPVMWRRWLIVERLDVVCRVGAHHEALPLLEKVKSPETTSALAIMRHRFHHNLCSHRNHYLCSEQGITSIRIGERDIELCPGGMVLSGSWSSILQALTSFTNVGISCQPHAHTIIPTPCSHAISTGSKHRHTIVFVAVVLAQPVSGISSHCFLLHEYTTAYTRFGQSSRRGHESDGSHSQRQ